MRKRFSVTAKRLLSFALALVLLLSLCPVLPLTAEATWTPESNSYKNLSLELSASDADLVYENDQAYDWSVIATQTITTSTVSLTIRGIITNVSTSDIVATCIVQRTMAYNTPVKLVSASDFGESITSMEGTFQLTCEIYKSGGSTLYGTYTADETFSRTFSGPAYENGWYIFDDDWTFASNKMKGQFKTKHQDLVFTDDELYDWEVYLGQSMGNTYTISVSATVRDSGGNVVGTPVTLSKTSTSGNYDLIFSASEYPNLPMDKSETYTLTLTAASGGQTYATLVKSFTRKVTAPTIKANAYSRSKPNMFFTYADPIDLVLHIEKTDGVEEIFYAATTITNTNGDTIAEKIYVIPASTNIDVSVKDMVPVTNIKTSGNYSVNVALYSDISAPARYTTTIPFAVVAMDRTVTVSITGSSSFAGTVPNLTVNAQKDDGVTEYCTALVTVTDTDTDKTVYSNTFEGPVSGTSANPTKLYPNLDNLPIVGNFRMDVVVKDSEGITRGTAYKNFTRISSTPLTANLTDSITGSNKAGMIFSDTDNPLVLTINHPSSANKTLKIRYTGTYNGEALDETRNITMPANGSITLNAKDFIKYGIYENLHISIYDAAGAMRWEAASTYSFSFVMDSSSASMSLLNINDHYTNSKINGDNSLKLPLSAQTGASMWRCTIPWVTVEKSTGEYIFTAIDAVATQSQQLGMQALIILAYENALYGDPDPRSPAWLNAYANYCYATAKYLAENYPDLVVGFEIWNEWNHATMSKVPDGLREGDLYAQVVIAASKKIRQVNTEEGTSFKVLGGATAGDGYIPGTNTDEFLDEMLPVEGLIKAIDGFSFHTYPNPEMGTSRGDNPRYFEFVSPGEFDYANRIHSVKERLIANGASEDIEIWLTETGWSTIDEQRETGSDGAIHITTGVTEQEQAAYMTQLFAWALADGTLDRIFWYDLMNDQKDPEKDGTYDWYDYASECNWGLIHCCSNTGDEPLAYSAKQGYVAMCAIGTMLSGATNGKSINLGSGIHAYQFEKDGHYLTVAWTDDDAATTRTATSNGSIVITDMFGNATTYNGTATLELSECPIYVEYAKSDVPTIS